MTEHNKALVLKMIDELWNGHDLTAIDRYYHPDYRNVDPANFFVTDKETLKVFTEQLFNAFPDFHATVHELVAEGNVVVKVWTAAGTFKNEIFGVPANHQAVQWDGINLYRIKDGLVMEQIWAQDFLGLMNQMGVNQ